MTPEVRELVMKNENAESIKVFAQKHGMTTLRESAIAKALEGETSLEEVFRVTTEEGSSHEEDAEIPPESEAAS
jgi:type II secretory ATPase GspE/PulE/Tfp pilus assembly ATPase PilB-like protein